MASSYKLCARLLLSAVFALHLGLPTAHAATAKHADKVVVVKKKGAAPAKAVKSRSARKSVGRTAQRRSASALANARTHRKAIEAVGVRSLPARASVTQVVGLHATSDDLGLKSNAVMVVDQETHKVLFDKNGSTVLPIASLTKLMTALVVTDAGLPMDEQITITQEDVDTLKGSSSRLSVGTTLMRGELLHLALMSSENRAAHALGRTFPGGTARFVETMNVKAKLVGMNNTQYVDPTGLSPSNQSSAKDLATLVSVAYERPMIRNLSTSPSYEVASGHRTLQYRNTNQLVSNPQWDIGLQKTGYIAEAGRCLVMQATVAGRQLIMVFLDSAGKLTRIADAERVRRWMEAQPSTLF